MNMASPEATFSLSKSIGIGFTTRLVTPERLRFTAGGFPLTTCLLIGVILSLFGTAETVDVEGVATFSDAVSGIVGMLNCTVIEIISLIESYIHRKISFK